MLKFSQMVFALIFGAAWILSTDPAEAKRVALVIGNETYQPAATAPADTRVATPVPPPSSADPLSKPQRLRALRNPVRDAKAFAEILKAAGYDVLDRYNLDFKGFNAALDDFAEKSIGATEAIVFFAGHGMKIKQFEGRTLREKNVLAPIDAEISCDLSRSSGVVIEMEKVTRAVEGVPKQVFIFDACRDDPFQHCPAARLGRLSPVSIVRRSPSVPPTARRRSSSPIRPATAKWQVMATPAVIRRSPTCCCASCVIPTRSATCSASCWN